MNRLLCLAAVLLPAAGFGAEPLHVALPGMTGVNIPAQLVGFYGEHLAQKLAEQGIRVTTAKQVAALLGFERQKQLLGCADDSSCLTEITGALNVDVLLLGDVARLGETQQFNLKAVNPRTGKPLAAVNARVEGEDLILPTLDRAAARLAAELSAKLGRPLPDVPGALRAVGTDRQEERLESGPRPYAWIPAAAGVVGAGVGTLFFLQSRQAYLQLTSTTGAPLSGSEVARIQDAGQRQQTLALASYGASAAALALAGVMFALGSSTGTVSGGVVLAPGGAGVTVAGVLP